MSAPAPQLRPATRGARVALGAGLAWIVVSVLVWNLPDGPVRRALGPATTPLVRALALEQRWALFSPDPLGRSVYVDVGFVHADGSRTTITLPGGYGALRDVRWRKWVGRIERQDRQHLWSAAATWFARPREGRPPPREVTLTRRSSPTPAPGTGAARTWTEFEFYHRSLVPHPERRAARP